MTQTKQTGLPAGYRLDEYTIVRELSSGGFSRVYLAENAARHKFAIKEYLPRELAHHTDALQVTVLTEVDREAFRIGRKCFFEEARVLAGIRHPNVVRVKSFFSANQTVYMVMSYTSGHSLAHEIDAQGGALPEHRIRRLFGELIGGVREVHSHHLLHLDIKPANIYLKRSGSPVLLDFGAARQNAQDGERTLVSMYTPGFAAPEQYARGDQLGPWTDIYSLGACLYACLGVGAPPPAPERQDGLPLPGLKPAQRRYSASLVHLVESCMALTPMARPGSLLEVQKALALPYDVPKTGWRDRLQAWWRQGRSQAAQR